MFRALPLLACLAAPAYAQTAGQCIGIVDGLAWLHANGYNAQPIGEIAGGGTLTIYTDASGGFLVVVMDDKEACIAAQGFAWRLMPDA